MRQTLLLPLALLAAPLLAQRGSTTPTVDKLIELEAAASPRLSPDGRQVAYLLTTTDWAGDRFVSQLWVQEVTGGTPRQLTRHADGVSNIRWSPDGRWISWVSTRDRGKSQLFALPVAGGEPLQLTRHDAGITAYAWSPDSRMIAFTAPASAAPRAGRDSLYGAYEVVRRDYVMQALHTIEVAAAKRAPQPGVKRTTSTAWTVGNFEWAPDNASIAFAAQRTPDPVTYRTTDIHVLRLRDDSVRAVVTSEGSDDDPHWSPDGTQLLYTIAPGYFRNQKLAIVPATGGTPRIVNGALDEQPQVIAWHGTGIYVAASRRTASHLFRIDPASGAVTQLSAPDSLVGSGWSLTPDARQVAFVHASAEGLPEVAVTELATFAPRTITDLSRQIRDWRLGTREVTRWRSTDGTEIEGILIKPRDFDPTRRYPLLCVIHGGPTGIDRPVLPDARYYPVDLWVARGALVLKVNYRGSAGYGERFRSLNYRNLGVGDAWDVLSGVDALVRRGWVDPARVASMGWSQGGYISAFLTTSSTRFAAISVGAGISDWRTYYYNTDITPFTINYLGADPVADPAIYARTSPVDYARTARTPTLIQHGENDRRVPIANAYQLRQVLEDRGVPVEMVVYKGFGHGITKPRAQRAVMQHNLAWFNHHLFGDPAPDFTASAPPPPVGEGNATTPRR